MVSDLNTAKKKPNTKPMGQMRQNTGNPTANDTATSPPTSRQRYSVRALRLFLPGNFTRRFTRFEGQPHEQNALPTTSASAANTTSATRMPGINSRAAADACARPIGHQAQSVPRSVLKNTLAAIMPRTRAAAATRARRIQRTRASGISFLMPPRLRREPRRCPFPLPRRRRRAGRCWGR